MRLKMGGDLPSAAHRNYRASLARGKLLFLRALSFHLTSCQDCIYLDAVALVDILLVLERHEQTLKMYSGA